MTARPLALLLASLACVAATDETITPPVSWDWVPATAYWEEPLDLVLRPGPGQSNLSAWQAQDQAHQPLPLRVQSDGGSLLLALPRLAPTLSTIAIQDDQGRACASLTLVAPGQGRNLTIDQVGDLCDHDHRALLVVPRREAFQDRRWGVLRPLVEPAPSLCHQVLTCPTAAWGASPLLALIAAMQAVDPAGGVVVLLDGRDRFAGWKHRHYRQALAWLIEDLRTRGAGRLVLVHPAAPQAELAGVLPLWTQVEDVAIAYGCETVGVRELADHSCWSGAGEGLSPTLNDAGRRRLEALCQPCLAPGAWPAPAGAGSHP